VSKIISRLIFKMSVLTMGRRFSGPLFHCSHPREVGTNMRMFSDLVHFVEVFSSEKLKNIVICIAMDDICGPSRITVLRSAPR